MMKTISDIVGQDLGMYRKNINYKRHYIVPGREDTPFVSVTTVVGDVISKPALVGWAKNIGIEAGQKTMADYRGALIDDSMIKSFPVEARSHLNTLSSAAADYGIEAHSLIEEMIDGRDPVIPTEFKVVIESFKK